MAIASHTRMYIESTVSTKGHVKLILLRVSWEEGELKSEKGVKNQGV